MGVLATAPSVTALDEMRALFRTVASVCEARDTLVMW